MTLLETREEWVRIPRSWRGQGVRVEDRCVRRLEDGWRAVFLTWSFSVWFSPEQVVGRSDSSGARGRRMDREGHGSIGRCEEVQGCE